MRSRYRTAPGTTSQPPSAQLGDREGPPTPLTHGPAFLVPSHDQIATCAYDIFIARGAAHGSAEGDWRQAIEQLRRQVG